VVNVTVAAAAIPPCDGTHPACLRLTSTLWTDGALFGPRHPHAHRFHGDTLIFYADALSGLHEVHRGPAFAWRPGWQQARRIASERAMECWGHGDWPLVWCVEDLAGDPVRPGSMELRAGPIADGADTTLPSLGRILPLRTDGRLAWQAAFSPDGAWFAFSSLDIDLVTETLKVVPTAQLGQTPPVEIVRGATDWRLSYDGGRVYFLREAGPQGPTLLVADFPSGANPADLVSGVEAVTVLGEHGIDRGVAVATSTQGGPGAVRVLPDPRKPAGWTTVVSHEGDLMALQISPDARFTAWTDDNFVVRVAKHSDLSTCVLNHNPRLPAHSPTFLRDAGLVFWGEDSGGDLERRDGYYADPADCSTRQRFAQAVYFLAPIDNRGLVFADETDDNSQRATLKYVPITDGKTWPQEGPVRVHPDIDGPSVVPASWDPLILLFRVSVGEKENQGLYLFGPVLL